MNLDEILSIGRHRISCASIESPVVDKLLAGVSAKLIYSDPPWGDGNLKYWATMNKKQTGNEFKPLSYDQLLRRIYDLINRYVNGHIMIETGLRWADQLQKDFEAIYYNVRPITVMYDSDRENILMYATTRPEINWLGIPNELYNYQSVKELVGYVTEPGDIVIDPCCGMGYTAQACIDHGLTFMGNEFNEKRLAKTIARLKK